MADLDPFWRDIIELFFAAAFLIGRLTDFLAVVTCLFFLVGAGFFAGATFFALGAAVIFPGRLGFLEGAFLPLVARTL
jgi:hypothetical protein